MRKPIIAGNWKMFKTIGEAVAFIADIKEKVNGTEVEAVICAPFTNLSALVEVVQGSAIKIGAQNLHFEDSGAFTGEISGIMLKHIGVQYVIIGHSERRAYFAETNDIINKKVHAAFRNGLTPIVCVGESLAERQDGATNHVCKVQTEAAFQSLSAESHSNYTLYL